MKNIIALLFIGIIHIECMAQASPAEQVAERIATKMKDSLALTEKQKQTIFSINMQLHSQKMTLRQQQAQSPSLRLLLQQVENTRDSLYRTVLDTDKYLLYKQKKINLVQ